MEVLLLAVLIGLIPAIIAQSKGRNFLAWWIYGAMLFIVALPHSLIMGKNQPVIQAAPMPSPDLVPCPECAELIQRQARKCRFCGAALTPPPPAPAGPRELRCYYCAHMNGVYATSCEKCGQKFQ